MYLGRVRRAARAPVELAARAGDPGDGQPERLLPLSGLPGAAAADPVAFVNADVGGTLSALVAERLQHAAPADLLFADQVLFEAPVAYCSKICCLALNYRAHAAESKLEVPPTPVLFFKPPSAITGHGRPVLVPSRTTRVEHEIELAVIIGSVTRDCPPEKWRAAVAGYTVINDMTARDLQEANMRRNQPWDQAKAFDTFAPLGPYLVTPDEVADPQNLDMTLVVDDEVRQAANTAQMVFDIATLIADLSDGMTLLPGDIIATGTTAGIAPLRHGDTMHASIAGIGTLTNTVLWP